MPGRISICKLFQHSMQLESFYFCVASLIVRTFSFPLYFVFFVFVIALNNMFDKYEEKVGVNFPINMSEGIAIFVLICRI